MFKKIAGLACGIAVAALAVCTYAIGARLGPDRSTGQNLYRNHGNFVQVSTTSAIVPASYNITAKNQLLTHLTSDDTDSADLTADGPGATFQQVYILLKHNYVDGVPDDSKLGHGAAAAMVASLGDPNSHFLEQPEMREMQDEQKGTYHGIGAVTAIRVLQHGDANSDSPPSYTEYKLTIVAPLPGTPAEKAGLKAGDTVVGVNGKWVAGYDLVAANAAKLKTAQDDPVAFNKLVAALQKQNENSITLIQAEAKLEHADSDDTADKSTTLNLDIERAGSPKLTIPVPVDQTTQVPAVTGHNLPGNLGYIRIAQFSDETTKDLDSVLNGLGADLKGLVVDLRDAPGGDVDAAAEIAGKLSGAKSLGIVEHKGNQPRQIPVNSTREANCPLVVLVNGGTANTAELLASALRDQGIKLIGEKTYGDGMDVASVPLRDGSGFTMTVGQFFTSAHKTINGVGLTPDVTVPASATGDEQLNQAISSLSGRVAGVPSARG